MRIFRTALIAAAAASTVIGPLPAYAATAAPHPSVQPDGIPAKYSSLEAMVALSPTDVWAAGYAGGRGYSPVMRHWDGERWKNVAIESSGGYLTDMAAAAPDDIWVVGQTDLSAHTYAGHWDGKTWTHIETPDEPGQYTHMHSIDVISSTYVIANGNYCLTGEGPCYDFALRWNGEGWVPAPNAVVGLRSFAAVSPDDAWGVGTKDNRGVVKHWNGAAWKGVHLGRAGANMSLTSVTAISSYDVWAVGSKRDAAGHIVGTATMHWDGESWTRVRDAVSDPDSSLLEVTASASDNVWAVGYQNGHETAVQRWDGRRWQQVANPTDDDVSTQLSAVGPLAPDDVWIVGRTVPEGDFKTHFLTMHWDGATWTVY